MKSELIQHLQKTAQTIGIEIQNLDLDYPENSEFGDFSTNIALIYAKSVKSSPKELAEKILDGFKKDMPEFVESVSVAGPGFINFKIKDRVFTEGIIGIQSKEAKKQKSKDSGNSQRKVLIEYTDPNIFKAFHIGHLMSNAIGESLSRLIEYTGSRVTRICYPSDIGLHIAKSIWAMKRHESEIPADDAPVQERTAFLGKMYVEGTKAYESDEMSGAGITAKDDIDSLNKILYEKSSPAINALYEKGRKWSLDHFESLYERLGTHFDGYIYESEMAPIGLDIVRAFLNKGVFVESDGAIVFKGEQHGLHTRVFINSHGLPTYEAKEMGLNLTKFKKYPDTDLSIVVTASEQNEYFKVVTKTLSLIDANVGSKTKHIGHGMLRFATGKMSSRTGNVITAEALIDEMKAMFKEKIEDSKLKIEDSETRDKKLDIRKSHVQEARSMISDDEINEIADIIAIGAIKYTILRQSIGSDVIFDSAKSISFEGDSGPYLQYSVVRAKAVMEKAENEGVNTNLQIDANDTNIRMPEKVGVLEKLLATERFQDVIGRACTEYAPQQVAGYLINLAGAFNSFYAGNTIVGKDEPLSPYRVALTKKFVEVMTDGLSILGIKVPRRM